MDFLQFLWTGLRYYVFIATYHWYMRFRLRHPTSTFIFECVVLLLLIALVCGTTAALIR